MPEIAEVARITHFLRAHLVGKTISKVHAADDTNVFNKVGTTGAAFQSALAGKTVTSAGSQGKYFWLTLSSPPHPVMHFGMTGWIHIRGSQTAYTRYAERHANEAEIWPPKFWKFHLETEGENPVAVAFTDARRFGRIRLVDCEADEIRKHTPLVENGPDPVQDRERFTEEYFRAKMRKRHVPVKALLLDQSMISGIGNWVGDEIMYQARFHPEQYCDSFSDEEIATLYKAVCYVCDTAVGVLGDSDKFPEDWLFNWRWSKGKKDGETVLPNGEEIKFLTVGGRTSCVVPSRQRKTGRTVEGVEEDGPDVKEEGKSRFWNGDGEVERPKKKSRTTRQKIVKEVSPAPEVKAGKTRGRRKKESSPTSEEKPIQKRPKKESPTPGLESATVRRRSTRLSKTGT
ncbi:formamidopyrimidine-DNA glycosylase [Xylariaceae sp. FL1019]|nr:formamidopyrimidine-DNA glycosylase [Xylariaceae sp. FL1019]